VYTIYIIFHKLANVLNLCEFSKLVGALKNLEASYIFELLSSKRFYYSQLCCHTMCKVEDIFIRKFKVTHFYRLQYDRIEKGKGRQFE